MQAFLSRHAGVVKGVLSGFDRVRFRGTIRWLASLHGLGTWLNYSQVANKDFTAYAKGLTDQIRKATQALADKAGRPLQYLPSSSERKEDLARQIAERDQIATGLVCVFTVVEPCKTFEVGPNRATKHLELRVKQGKCLYNYVYWIDPVFGWLNIRLQTWFPFTVHIVLNGREWLSRMLLKHGVDFERRDNCFVEIADLTRAQKFMYRQLKTKWPHALNRLLRVAHPSHRTLFGREPLSYYWSADETEWASDVMFQTKEDLSSLYPGLVRHSLLNHGSSDVLRFLGKCPHVACYRQGEILTHLGHRPEGVRVKHALDRNSLKMYDKQELVLRVETTINNPRQMKVYRASEKNPTGPKSWQKLRKGVADLARRAEISQNSNARYLDAIATADTGITLGEATAGVCRPTQWQGRPVRALQPLAADDAKLLQTVGCGEFLLQGFRNRDLRALLFAEPSSDKEKRSQTAKVTRMIRMLRAHGIIHKVAKTHRYTVSTKGHQLITALNAARAASTRKLAEIAA